MTKKGVMEGRGLTRQFFIFSVALYLRNCLSQQVKIEMILCVDYMPMTNVLKMILVKNIFMVVSLYQKIQV